MTNHRQDESRRRSAIQSLLDMFHISNFSTLPLKSGEDVDEDVDEPPDESPSPTDDHPAASQQDAKSYTKNECFPGMNRRVSMLTRALMPEVATTDAASPPKSHAPAGLSRASTVSTASMPSTADLTSDMGDTSPARSATPSPPLPSTLYHQLHPLSGKPKPLLAAADRPSATSPPEPKKSKIEASLGRKRCITFAGADRPVTREPHAAENISAEFCQPPPKRKCMLTFACPAPSAQASGQVGEQLEKRRLAGRSPSYVGLPPQPRGQLERSEDGRKEDFLDPCVGRRPDVPDPTSVPTGIVRSDSAARSSHQLVVGSEREDAWVHEPNDSKRKLTLSDCMRKENAIRKIGEEAAEEAEQEEDEQEELEEDDEDADNEDDFAPSDDGNESDNEAGFAESDQDSDHESDDQLWVPSNTVMATTENLASNRSRTSLCQSENSSTSSSEQHLDRRNTTESIAIKQPKDRRVPKSQYLRPSTPDLPDSTDFVCGTLDEDRPLEAAYMSCLERKKRDKHIPIPQDIDPSFPTTDPEDMDDEDSDLDSPEDHLWLKDQLEGFEDDPNRKRSTRRSPHRSRFSPTKQGLRRSPPPPRHHNRLASPPPQRRLFNHSPKHLQSPLPPATLLSPPGTKPPSPNPLCGTAFQSRGLMISQLGQRPHMTVTSSLPQTPNPFFYQGRTRLRHSSRNTRSGHVLEQQAHVRGPVDIVAGLEKKRQKRREKFWRQNCRKAAKEHADHKTIIPGRGAERMRELGLECAERTRGYGLGQHRPLIISL